MPKAAELGLFTLGKPLRRKTEDESILWDHKCKKCGGELIGKWNWRDRKYDSFRCSKIDCDFGNTDLDKAIESLVG